MLVADLIASVSAMAALVVLLCIAFVAIFIHLRRYFLTYIIFLQIYTKWLRKRFLALCWLFVYFRKRLLKEEMENMEWKISFCDLDTSSGRTFHSMCSKVKQRPNWDNTNNWKNHKALNYLLCLLFVIYLNSVLWNHCKYELDFDFSHLFWTTREPVDHSQSV